MFTLRPKINKYDSVNDKNLSFNS